MQDFFEHLSGHFAPVGTPNFPKKEKPYNLLVGLANEIERLESIYLSYLFPEIGENGMHIRKIDTGEMILDLGFDQWTVSIEAKENKGYISLWRSDSTAFLFGSPKELYAFLMAWYSKNVDVSISDVMGEKPVSPYATFSETKLALLSEFGQEVNTSMTDKLIMFLSNNGYLKRPK